MQVSANGFYQSKLGRVWPTGESQPSRFCSAYPPIWVPSFSGVMIFWFFFFISRVNLIYTANARSCITLGFSSKNPPNYNSLIGVTLFHSLSISLKGDMHNTYVSSSVLSLRSTGSLSFSFNDYCNFSNERCDRIPLSPSPSSQCCSCCSCCISFATHGVPINPSFLIGLRQSTLVQWSPCRRRLILAGGNRYFHPFPVYDLDRDSYEVACYIKERYGSGSIEKRRKGRFRCRVSERKNERYQLGVLGDADVVVSLLSDEIGEEAFDGRDRNDSSYQRVELEKRRKYGSECYVGNKKRDEPDRRVNYGSQCHTRNDKRVEVQTKLNSGSEFYGKNKERTKVEGRRNYGSESYRGNKKGVGSGLLDSDSKCDYASVTVESGGQAFKRNEGREGSLRGETHRGRRRSSSCSSYYSFSSLEDFESDTEAKDRDVGFVEDLSSGYKEDSGRNAEVRFEGRVVEEFRRHSDDKVRNGEFVEQKYTASGKGVDWDCRKKSEKRLIELSSAEKESREKSSEFRLEMARTRESHYGKASGSLDDKQEESSAVNLNQRRREKYTQSNNQPESRRKYEGDTEMHQSHDGDVEITSQSQKRFSGREENMMVEVDSDWGRRAEHHRTVSHVAGRNDLRKKTHHIIGTSELRSSGTERISDLQCHSESRMKSQQDAANLVQSSVHGAKEQQEQMSQVRIGQMDLIKKSGCFSERSEIHDINIRKTSNLQSETHIKNQEENSGLVSISQAEVKRQHSHAGQEPQRIQSRNGSFDSSSESVAQVGNVLVVSESQRTSEKRMIDQESSLTSVAETTAGTRERPSQTDERVVQTNLGKQGQKPVRQLSSHQKASQQFSSSQASLTSISQERTQQITVDRDKRNSQAILMPPSSQLVDRGSWLDNPTSETATQKVSSETSESGSSALFMNSRRTPPPCGETYVRDRKGGGSAEPLSFVSDDDALNSAHRSEQSSLQIIGEFVEKARHELSTSEIQKEKKTSDSELPSEVENHGRKSSGQYGSEDFQLKPHGSRQLSGGFGAKGPADEMWDVRDPSVQEPAGPDVSEASMATGNDIVKRTGRSLWSIIADVVRLRWGSLAGSPSSGGRSSGKSLSNESVSSDTWFSGREPDETSGENVKRERRSMPQEGMFSHQLEEGQTSIQSQGELSDSMRSKGKSKPHETDKLLSSSILEGQSALRIASLTSGEENLRQNEGGSTSEASVAKEVSRTGKFDAPVSISMEEVKQPVSLSLIEQSGSQRKDGELKQRKLQRNKQVLRDRFDEWEEAYKLEMEQQKIDEMFMREALLEAKKAADTWEVPVGAVLVQHGKIIARGYNLVEELRDSTAHAEMICIREASNLLKSWRLAETTLYVTLEPCPMCAGAILQARIDTVVWGAPNKLLGADGSWIRLFPNRGNDAELTDKPAAPVHPFHPKMTIRRGILASECADAMQQFFQLRRRKKENPDPPSPSPSCLPVANHPSKILTKMHDIFHIMFCL